MRRIPCPDLAEVLCGNVLAEGRGLHLGRQQVELRGKVIGIGRTEQFESIVVDEGLGRDADALPGEHDPQVVVGMADHALIEQVEPHGEALRCGSASP